MTRREQKKLTVVEWEAVETALNQCLAGEVLDGYDEDDPEHGRKWRAMVRALEKVQHNLSAIEAVTESSWKQYGWTEL